MDEGGLLEGVGLEPLLLWSGTESLDPIPVTVSDDAGAGSVDLMIDSLLGQINGGYKISVESGTREKVSRRSFGWIIRRSHHYACAATYRIRTIWSITSGPGEHKRDLCGRYPDSYHTFAVLLDSMEEQAESNEGNNFGAGDTTGESSIDGGAGDSGSSSGLANLEFKYVVFSSEPQRRAWVDGKTQNNPWMIFISTSSMATSKRLRVVRRGQR